LDNACYLFKLSNSNESKISLYHIYVNGLGVKKNLKKANSFIKNLPANTPLYAFKSNISEGIKIEKIEEKSTPELPKKEMKQRKIRKKNVVKSFFKKIISLFKYVAQKNKPAYLRVRGDKLALICVFGGGKSGR
jgi:hypothetical protein